MNGKKLGIAVGSVAASAAIIAGGAAIASADPSGGSTATSTASPTSGASAGQSGTSGERSGGGSGATGKGAGSADTPVTGDEAAKASAAVTAKDSSVTVTSVRKDPDGSYDVLGTKDGSPVMFDVSADLATVSDARTGGGRGGGPGGGGSADTPVTGDEAAKASAAVTAKDSSVTVTSVRKDPDGSYDVLGTKDGSPVMFDVSADLATVSDARTGGPGGGHGNGPAGSGGSSASPTQGAAG